MKRIISILLLSFMMVSLVAPVVLYCRYNNKVKVETIRVDEALITGKERIVNYNILEKRKNETKNDFDIALEKMKQKMSEIESIEDKQEWFIAYKDIIEKYAYIIDPPETIYDYFSEEELDLFFRVVQAEVGDEYSFEQKVNVVNVILNRIEHEKFPDKISDILVSNQFQPIEDGRYKEVRISESTILACEYAFIFPDTTDGSLFFDSNETLKYEFVMNDGIHNFYKLKGETKV